MLTVQVSSKVFNRILNKEIDALHVVTIKKKYRHFRDVLDRKLF